MCGRYRRTTREEELCRIYRIPIPPQRDLPISYNIVPAQDVLTIRFNPKTQQRSLDPLRWGLIPHRSQDKRIAYRTINKRRNGPSDWCLKNCPRDSGRNGRTIKMRFLRTAASWLAAIGG